MKKNNNTTKKSKAPPLLAAQFYNKIINLHHSEFNYKNLHFRKWLNLLRTRLHKGDKVLDLGCGNGRVTKYFTDHGHKGVGIDISVKMLKLARKYVPRGKFIRADFTKKLNLEPGSFGAIISFFALNHVPKRIFKQILKNNRQLLNREGYLLLGLVVGKSDGLFEGFYGKKLQLYGASYTKKELIGILKEFRYRIIRARISHFKGKYFEEDDIYVLAKYTHV